MRVAVIGTGYVGLVTGACFSQMGNSVICVDIDNKKIENLKQGILSIYEPSLEEMVKENYKKNNLNFTTDIKEAVEISEIVFIAVGTPMDNDGSADLQFVLRVAEDIAKYMTKKILIVNKSTVPVGTGDKVREVINRELERREVKIDFDVASNPEFLKEGSAVNDFMKPDRVIVGVQNQKSLNILRELYRPFTINHDRFISMDIRSAEMTKYTANAMLATKISFINEVANICERVGADVNRVRIGIGSDSRIGYKFIYPGCGYGGSCFPKDVQALVKISRDVGYEPKIISAVEEVNQRQKFLIVDKIINKFGNNLNGLVFGVWGLSFKPETDDMREASSISIINKLTNAGAKIKVYDPKAMKEAKKFYLKDNDKVEYFDSKYDVLNSSDALILITEWKEFRSPDWQELKKRLKNPIIFDGRNQYDKNFLQEHKIEYFQIGVN